MWSTKPARSGESPIVFGGSWTAFGPAGRARREQQVGEHRCSGAARSVLGHRRTRSSSRRRGRRRAARDQRRRGRPRRRGRRPGSSSRRTPAGHRPRRRCTRSRRGELEADRYRRRLAERRRGVDEHRRRAVAGDHEHAPVRAEIELVDRRGQPQGGVRHRRPRGVAVGVGSDRPPVGIGRGSSQQGERRSSGQHRADADARARRTPG